MGTRVIVVILLTASVAWGRQEPAAGNAQSDGQDMPGMDMSANKSKGSDGGAGMHAMHAMEGHMDMGPHMKMTALRALQPGDTERARQLVNAARAVSEKYLDYHAALADGFKIFHPELPQKVYHFTNYRYGIAAAFSFNPEHPTSLLYEKHGAAYKLIGVMYTAPKSFSEDQLNQRIPLSIAQWHEHVNFCIAPAGRKTEALAPHPQFGLRGSIATQQACDAAGGTFRPVVFSWMVHVYPFEKDQKNIWSIEH
jgi:hypothetical protein